MPFVLAALLTWCHTTGVHRAEAVMGLANIRVSCGGNSMNDTASGKTVHDGVLKTANHSDGLSNPREHHDRLDCEKRSYNTNLRFAPVETEEIGELRVLWETTKCYMRFPRAFVRCRKKMKMWWIFGCASARRGIRIVWTYAAHSGFPLAPLEPSRYDWHYWAAPSGLGTEQWPRTRR